MHPNISNALSAYVVIRAKYFDEFQLKPFETIREEIFTEHETLTVGELAVVLTLVKRDYEKAIEALQKDSIVSMFQKRLQSLASAYPFITPLKNQPSDNDSLKLSYR